MRSGIVRPGFDAQVVALRSPAGSAPARWRSADRSGAWSRWAPAPGGCTAGAGDAAPATEQLAFVTVPNAPAVDLDLPPGSRAVVLNGTDGPALRPASAEVSERSRLAGLPFLSRAAWGADESLRFDAAGVEKYPPTFWPVQTFTVHHTATGNDDPDPAARMRAIYRYQAIDLGYGDFGYHFLVDEAGRVYEGRRSGGDVLPGFDPAGWMVNGSHVGGYNAGNVGVVLLGTFVAREPTAAARRSLTLLLAALTGWCHVDPLASVTYVNPISGLRRSVPAIAGHQDWGPTECPGGVLSGMLGDLRQEIAAVLADPRRSAFVG
ncbi:N-acetylmuramoyl-L-alanine amidase [Micromonospora chalcea]|uniref:N-acetylmuramoyl-L-alanine amidase n=1 Tax=Micromonospora sp. TSRI0369 TaxID=1703936 RepID=UPI000940094F|nr:N-acetylmuramoyl-L-alanine amidase [Micromonospora sp. TSRI0369]